MEASHSSPIGSKNPSPQQNLAKSKNISLTHSIANHRAFSPYSSDTIGLKGVETLVARSNRSASSALATRGIGEALIAYLINVDEAIATDTPACL